MIEENDKKLVDRICRGDMAAFQDLVEQHKKKIYFIAYDILGDYHEAEDISQDVFIKVFRNIKRFRKDAKMSSWIHQITVNTCIDVIRKRKSKPKISMDDGALSHIEDNPPVSSSMGMNPEKSAEAAIFQQQINNALQNVTPRERTVFVMRHYNDFKINEIADALEVSSGTVKSLLFRALKKLRKELAPLQKNPKLEVSYE